MWKKILIIVAVLVVAALGVAAYMVPMSLRINVDKDIYMFDKLNKEDIQVYAASYLGKLTPVDFKYEESRENNVLTLDVSAGRLSGIYQKPLITGKLEVIYDADVIEGDRFKKSAIKATYTYEDGKTEIPTIKDCKAPDIFTKDTAIQVETSHGKAEVQVWVSSVNKIEAVYDATVHQGDEYNEKNIKVSVSFANGATKDNVEFVCLKAPKYINEKTTLSISTSYGDAECEIKPVKASGIKFDGKTRYHENDVFQPKKVTIAYGDGEEVSTSDIEWLKGVGETLHEGVQEVRFKWHEKEYSTTLTVYAANNVTDAARENDEELNQSTAKYVDDSLYVAVSEHENYYMTHIITVNAGEQLRGDFGGGVGYGYSEAITAAADRLKWGVGVNGSNPSSAPSIIIRNGKLEQDGETNGSEICMTIDGVLFSPDAGKSGDELLGMGVKNMWWTDEPTLIQTGKAAEGIDDGPHCRTIIAMKQIGEYYILSTVNRGMDYAECISILTEMGCTYARPLGGDENEALMVGSNLVFGTAPAQLDFLYFTSYKES